MHTPSMMILYGSAIFVQRLKCQVSLREERPTQPQTEDGWSGDILKLPRVEPVAVMMHDVSLATIIVPLRAVCRFDEFLPRFLDRIGPLYQSVDGSINPANQSILVLRRTNRRLIGSMNNTKQLIGFTVADQRQAGEEVGLDGSASLHQSDTVLGHRLRHALGSVAFIHSGRGIATPAVTLSSTTMLPFCGLSTICQSPV